MKVDHIPMRSLSALVFRASDPESMACLCSTSTSKIPRPSAILRAAFCQGFCCVSVSTLLLSQHVLGDEAYLVTDSVQSLHGCLCGQPESINLC